MAQLGESFDAVLGAARSGEGWAYERLFTTLGRPVVAYLRGAGVEDPEGEGNEVFLRAFRGLERFTGDEGRFRAWIFTIAHHLIVDERRRRVRRPQGIPFDDGDGPAGPAVPDAAEQALASLGDDRVRALLAGLSPDQRDVLLLRVVADLSIEETAAALGKRPNAIKALQHRAVRTLRNRLESEAVTK